MNDGTTGIQVAPIASEAEMTALSKMFERAASSVVAASRYPAQIADLEAKLSTLSGQVDSMTAHNHAQDQTINDLRTERDSARAQVDRTDRDLAVALSDVNKLHEDNSRLASKVDALQTKLSQTEKERDDYGLEAMQAKDDLAKAHGTLNEFKAKLSAFFPEPKGAESEPKPQEPVNVNQRPHEDADKSWQTIPAGAESLPEKGPEPARAPWPRSEYGHEPSDYQKTNGYWSEGGQWIKGTNG